MDFILALDCSLAIYPAWHSIAPNLIISFFDFSAFRSAEKKVVKITSPLSSSEVCMTLIKLPSNKHGLFEITDQI